MLLPSSVVVKPLVTRLEVFEATEVDIGLFQEGARSVRALCMHRSTRTFLDLLLVMPVPQLLAPRR